MRHWKRWLVIGIVGGVVALVGGPFVYIHFIEGKAPPPLTLSTPSATTSAAQAGTTQGTVADDGSWKVSTGSIVGYRVNEVLFGQSNTAVGRTSSVTGSITVVGSTVTKASFTVDMTSVASDESRRDAQFNGRIMDTSTYPTGTFTLTEPIDLGPSGRRSRADSAGEGRPDPARSHQGGRVLGDGPVHRFEGRGGRLDPDHLLRLGHPEPELRSGDDRGSRRPRVRSHLHSGVKTRWPELAQRFFAG